MSIESAAPAAEAPIAAPIAPPPAIERDWNVSDAARFLAQRRQTKQAEPAPAEPPQELAPEANAAPVAQAPSEQPEATEPAEQPPIEPPRSWTQAEKERFQSLPRETQEYLHTREQERDREFRRSQNEIAEQRKAIDAEREAAAQERKTLAAKVPEIQKAIQEFLSDKYPDIKSMDDVSRMASEAQRLASEDPFTSLALQARLKAWEVDQRKIQLAMADAQEAQASEARERQSNLQKYQADETTKLAEFVPDVKDPAKLKDLTSKAINHLKSFDFSDTHLNDFAAQGDKPFIFSAGFQRILLNSMKYEELMAAPKAVPQALPTVQRPGVGKPAQSGNTARIQALESQMASASGVNQARIMAQIRQLRSGSR